MMMMMMMMMDMFSFVDDHWYVIVISDTALEHLDEVNDAATVVHYDVPNVQQKFARRLLTMRSFFSHECLQNRVWTLI